MNQAEWDACKDPVPMLESLADRYAFPVLVRFYHAAVIRHEERTARMMDEVLGSVGWLFSAVPNFPKSASDRLPEVVAALRKAESALLAGIEHRRADGVHETLKTAQHNFLKSTIEYVRGEVEAANRRGRDSTLSTLRMIDRPGDGVNWNTTPEEEAAALADLIRQILPDPTSLPPHGPSGQHSP